METLEKYQRLKLNYQKLKNKHKAVLKNYDSDIKHIMDLEAEILDINTKTMQDIIENNKRFNNN
jgi:hypothetical protein